MQFNIAEIKTVLKDAGHLVSEGEQLTLQDMTELCDWAYIHLGLSKIKVLFGMAYPSELPSTFPGHPDADKPVADDPSPAPLVVTPPIALEPVAPVVEAPIVTEPVVPVVETPPIVETPVVETPEVPPVVETPAVEVPVVETPVVETPEETPAA